MVSPSFVPDGSSLVESIRRAFAVCDGAVWFHEIVKSPLCAGDREAAQAVALHGSLLIRRGVYPTLPDYEAVIPNLMTRDDVFVAYLLVLSRAMTDLDHVPLDETWDLIHESSGPGAADLVERARQVRERIDGRVMVDRNGWLPPGRHRRGWRKGSTPLVAIPLVSIFVLFFGTFLGWHIAIMQIDRADMIERERDSKDRIGEALLKQNQWLINQPPDTPLSTAHRDAIALAQKKDGETMRGVSAIDCDRHPKRGLSKAQKAPATPPRW